MAGIIVVLIISWLLLWFVTDRNLSILGFKPTKTRVVNLGAGLLIGVSCCIVHQIMTTAFVNNSWVLNEKMTATAILERTKWILVSVLSEELIFRGALLYITIKKIGIIPACILSSICFGIYHWFTFNVFGNPFMMVITFIMTAIVGFSWALSFAKTNSLYLPIGLHFGWNLFYMVVFSNNAAGQAIFIRTNENQLQGLSSLLVFIFQIIALPLLNFWYLNRCAKKRKLAIDKEEQPSTEG